MRHSALVLLCALAGLAACGTDHTPTAPATEPTSARADASDPTPGTIALRKIGSFAGGGLGAAEITAFDRVSQRLFVVNGALGTVDVLDLRDPTAPTKITSLAVGGAANSVAADQNVVAVAVEGTPRTAPGSVVFFRATTLQRLGEVPVGALPDMLKFSPSGRLLVVANEGEPNDDYTIDPEGSVSIIDVTNINRPTVRTAGFEAFNGQEDALRAQGIRIFGPGASVAQDLEPEYVAIAPDERTAYVALQENNAFAVVDLASATVTRLVPLGFKDHSLAGNALDASDRDGPTGGPSINIRNWPVLGMYQPDGIEAFEVGGQTYIVSANEGDARDYDGFSEEARVNSLPLDPAVFTNAVCGGSCSSNARLGRLTVTNTLGRNPATGLFERLYAFGARSLSIWDAEGRLVWDSGSQLEQLTTSLGNVNFNASHDNNNLDDRSDNKGPEPEGVAVGRLGAKTFAFIGLERVGGIAVYDVSVPAAPQFVTYINSRTGTTGDLGPEGVIFVPARHSPNKAPLLIVGHEVSGTTAIYQIDLQ